MRSRIHVGLEIGTSKICAVVADFQKVGAPRILGVGEVPSRGVRKGEIVDYENTLQCVHDALSDAEARSETEIQSVWLAVTGSHLKSFNHRGAIRIPEEIAEISEQEVEAVEYKAQEVILPTEHELLHSLIQGYTVDGQRGVRNPVGMLAARLETDFHMIHGVRTRIQNAIRCVKECRVEVDGAVVSSVATAEAVLSQGQKENGAIVIDIGGGVTDYIVYAEGSVHQSGVLAVGGDHINSDISSRYRIPISRAEKLKIKEGATLLGQALSAGEIVLKNEAGFSETKIDREELNFIVRARMEEILCIVAKQVFSEVPEHHVGTGVILTGGCSLTHGIRELTESVFNMPVCLSSAQSVSGKVSTFENPMYSTAVGLTKYAEAVLAEFGEPSPVDSMLWWLGNWFGRKS